MLLWIAGPAAATSCLPDSIITFTRQAQIEGAGIDIAPGYRASETPGGDFLLPVSSVAGGDVDHFASTIQLVSSESRVALEDWFFDMSEMVITGLVIAQDGFGEDLVNRFVGTLPMFDVFPADHENQFVLELRDELAQVLQGTFGDDGTLFPSGFRFALGEFPAKPLQPVPEPLAGLLCAAGLAAAALRRRIA